jgi:NADPH:quinone reductase-like Zn-dependent oxidoreductase
VKEKYGVDHGINYNTHPDWEKEVLALTKGKGADLVIETGGSGTMAKSLASVKPGGQIGLFGFLSQAEQLTDLVIPIVLKGVVVRGIQVGSRQLFEQLLQFVHAKKLHMPIEHSFGFTEDQVHAAYEKLVSQTGLGKIAILLDN